MANGQAKLRFEAYASGQPIEVWHQGERRIIHDPGNFPWLFEAYQLNRDEEESPHFAVSAYQKYLRTDPRGIATTEALDLVTGDEAKQALVSQAIGHFEKDGRIFFYDQLITEVSQYLPSELGAEILRDPP